MHFIELLLCLPTNALRKFVDKHNRNNGANFLKTNKTGNICITLHWGAFLQPLLQWKSIKYYICWESVCSRSYPACNVHALYYHLQPALLYGIFSHCLINGTIFEKTLLSAKCVFRFPLQLFSETFLILRRNEWHDQKCTLDLLLNTRYCCRILMKIKFPQQNFEKFSKTKFHENRSSVSRIVPCPRRTDIAKLIVPFCNCANASKMKIDAEIFATSDNTMS